MPPSFWLDSNTLIESKKRWYRFEVVPGFWTFLDSKVAEGVICSPLRVYEELVDRTDDELAAWAKARKGQPLFIDPDAAVQKALAEVADFVNGKFGPTKATNDFLDGADPWLVAYGRVHGGTVVTLEAGAVPGKTPKVKLPDVCEQFGVPCDSLFEVVELLGMRLE
jgi:hypothetical protein